MWAPYSLKYLHPSSFALLSSFGCTSGFFQWQCQHSHGQLFLLLPIYVWFRFYFQYYHFSFFVAISSLLANYLGDKEATQLHTLLSVCELSGRWMVSSHQQTWLVTDNDAYLQFTWWLCIEELAVKFELYAMIVNVP